MIKAATRSLYFKRYTNCIKFEIIETSSNVSSIRTNSVVMDLKSLLKASGMPYRTRMDWEITKRVGLRIIYSIYFSDQALNQTLNDCAHSSMIQFISEPASDLHRELLLNDVDIEIRPKLLYNRFRYKVILRTGWRKDEGEKVKRWIKEQFSDREEGRKGDYLLMGTWVLSLYLKDEMDLTIVRLAIGDQIHKITRVDTTSEHGLA